MGSPDGGLLSIGGSSGSVQTGKWVEDGTVLYLVNPENLGVLGTFIVHLSDSQCSQIFSAEPNPVRVCDGSGLGQITLRWNIPEISQIEIRLSSPGGPLVLIGSSAGTIQTGRWVRDGMVFYLIDSVSRNTIATTTVSITSSGCPRLVATPNPIEVCDGSGVGETTLEWESDDSSATEIRIGSPGGQLFLQSNTNGSARTGKWVTDGMEFYLVDGDDQAVLASETVSHSQQGCSTNIEVTFFPNPVSKGAFGDCEGKYCYRVSLREVNGVSATLFAMIVDGNNLSDRIVDFFGTQRIPPFGSLSVNIVHPRNSGFSTWKFDSIDANGNITSSSGTVQLLQ